MEILAACRRTNKKILGIITANTAEYWVKRDFQFVTTGSDINFAVNRAKDCLADLVPTGKDFSKLNG